MESSETRKDHYLVYYELDTEGVASVRAASPDEALEAFKGIKPPGLYSACKVQRLDGRGNVVWEEGLVGLSHGRPKRPSLWGRLKAWLSGKRRYR